MSGARWRVGRWTVWREFDGWLGGLYGVRDGVYGEHYRRFRSWREAYDWTRARAAGLPLTERVYRYDSKPHMARPDLMTDEEAARVLNAGVTIRMHRDGWTAKP